MISHIDKLEAIVRAIKRNSSFESRKDKEFGVYHVFEAYILELERVILNIHQKKRAKKRVVTTDEYRKDFYEYARKHKREENK